MRLQLAWIQNFSSTSVVPPGADVIRASGGAGGITLTIAANAYQAQPASGVTVTAYETFKAIKVDAAVGAVTFLDSNGALFNGASSYALVDQYQWAEFAWNGTGWDVWGN
jgi:hypothetical protein